jgi:hypothetical protein
MQEAQQITPKRAVRKKTTKKAVRRGRPPNATQPAQRGRPKGVTTKKRGTTAKRKATAELNSKQVLRGRITEMRSELKVAKAELKETVKKERDIVKATQEELKQALKREQALIKLIELKDDVMRSFGARWVKKQISMIQKPPKRRRRKKAA